MMTAAPALPALPKALGRYRIQSEIDRGSMKVGGSLSVSWNVKGRGLSAGPRP